MSDSNTQKGIQVSVLPPDANVTRLDTEDNVWTFAGANGTHVTLEVSAVGPRTLTQYFLMAGTCAPATVTDPPEPILLNNPPVTVNLCKSTSTIRQARVRTSASNAQLVTITPSWAASVASVAPVFNGQESDVFLRTSYPGPVTITTWSYCSPCGNDNLSPPFTLDLSCCGQDNAPYISTVQQTNMFEFTLTAALPPFVLPCFTGSCVYSATGWKGKLQNSFGTQFSHGPIPGKLEVYRLQCSSITQDFSIPGEYLNQRICEPTTTFTIPVLANTTYSLEMRTVYREDMHAGNILLSLNSSAGVLLAQAGTPTPADSIYRLQVSNHRNDTLVLTVRSFSDVDFHASVRVGRTILASPPPPPPATTLGLAPTTATATVTGTTTGPVTFSGQQTDSERANNNSGAQQATVFPPVVSAALIILSLALISLVLACGGFWLLRKKRHATWCADGEKEPTVVELQDLRFDTSSESEKEESAEIAPDTLHTIGNHNERSEKRDTGTQKTRQHRREDESALIARYLELLLQPSIPIGELRSCMFILMHEN